MPEQLKILFLPFRVLFRRLNLLLLLFVLIVFGGLLRNCGGVVQFLLLFVLLLVLFPAPAPEAAHFPLEHGLARGRGQAR